MREKENPLDDSRLGERGKRILVARSTGRPRLKSPDGTRPALALLRRLGDKEFRARAALTEEQLETLDEIAAGRPPRNAVAIIHAIELKCGYAYGRPSQAVEITGKLSLEQLIAQAIEDEKPEQVTPQTREDSLGEEISAEPIQDSGSLEIVEPEPTLEAVAATGELAPTPVPVVSARPPVIRKKSKEPTE